MLSADAQTRPAFDWRRFLGYVTTIVATVMLMGVLGLLVLGHRPLEARAVGPAERVDISIQWPTVGTGEAAETWLPRQFQEDLLGAANAAWTGNSGGARLDAVANAMQASGWFIGTPTVRREPGSKVVVDGRWRVPAAVVRRDGKDYLISWNAMPMPPVYDSGAANLRAILNPAMPAPTKASGQRDFQTAWPGEDIAASLELLSTIVDKPWAGQVAAIDAASYPDDRSLTLVTAFNSRVKWGGRPTKPRQGDVSTAEKLARLGMLWKDSGRIDAKYESIDVSQPHLTIDARPRIAAPGETPAANKK